MLNSPLGGRRGIGFGLGRSWQRGGFSPTDIAGLQLWLDFSDASTLFVDAGITPVSADGDAIYQANDKSGNLHHLAQTILEYRPLYKTGIQNGLAAALGDGLNDYLTRVDALGFIGNPAYTLFAVGKTVSSIDPYPAILYIGDSNGGGYQISHTAEIAYRFNNGNVIFDDNYNNTSLGCFLREAGATYVQSELYYNGSVKSPVSSANDDYEPNLTDEYLSIFSAKNALGSLADTFSNMYIMEIVLYNSALSDANRQSVETYLNNKWAIY